MFFLIENVLYVLTEPLVAPTDVTVVRGSVKGTKSMLTWTPVDPDPDQIRGFFRGYRVSVTPYITLAQWKLSTTVVQG